MATKYTLLTDKGLVPVRVGDTIEFKRYEPGDEILTVSREYAFRQWQEHEELADVRFNDEEEFNPIHVVHRKVVSVSDEIEKALDNLSTKEL